MRSLPLIAVAFASCARPTEPVALPPRSLNECLLMSAQKALPDAITQSERLCREVFAAPGGAAHGLGPALYYLAGTGKCLRAEIRPDGSAEGGFGLCSQQARFERDSAGELLFTCVLPTTGEPPAVYRVSESADTLTLKAVRAPPSGMPAEWSVSRTLAGCSLATTDADRNLANQLDEHTEPEWLDAPLAAWKNDAHARPRRAPFTHN
jgi:hypothetical protein